MGFFKRIFSGKKQIVVTTVLGDFVATNNAGKTSWINKAGKWLLSVKGTITEPDQAAIYFLMDIEEKVSLLTEEIQNKLADFFKDAELELTQWQKQLSVVAVNVVAINNELAEWSIILEQSEEPYAHFNLFFQGNIITDISMDT